MQVERHGLDWRRIIWAVAFLVSLGTFVLALPYYYALLMTPCTGADCNEIQPTVEFSQALAALGVSLQWTALWNILIVSLLALAYTAFAVLLVWRRSSDRSVWLFSMILLMVGFFVTAAVDPLARINVFWLYFINIMNSVMWLSIVLLFYIFPDGRFVPAWSWLALLPPIALRVSLFLPETSPLYKETWPGYVEPMIVIAIFGASIVVQVYRYRYVSTPLQRQQTKWIVFGLISMALALLIVSLGFGDADAPPQSLMALALEVGLTLVWLTIFLTLPVTMTIAILRYRLWDIDLLIRRTLVYTVLTTILAVIYFSSVVGLQALFRLFTGQDQNAFVTVLSTLVIAALFSPLRRRLQDLIDRRLYRRQYDAEQVLVAFGATIREETDLARLNAELVRVVEETVQPTQVLLWLRTPPDASN